jgi:Uma2 family endonuclease
MAKAPRPRRPREIEYPSGDGKPLAETGTYVRAIIDTLQMLEGYFAGQPNVHLSGNLLLYYEEGNPRKRVAPDVFVVFGVPKEPPRDNYLVWKEGKAPDFILEITSKATRHEDLNKKWVIYRDILGVSEYFFFDPRGEYLDPLLQGFRLIGGDYVRIGPVAGQLPSAVLGLCLERHGTKLRLLDPASFQRLPTRLEAREAAERRAEEYRRRAEAAEAVQQQLAEENQRLRREIEALRRG